MPFPQGTDGRDLVNCDYGFLTLFTKVYEHKKETGEF